MRCAIVGAARRGRRARSPRSSGRRPRAASAPPAPRARSAGWQQVKISRSRSSSMLPRRRIAPSSAWPRRARRRSSFVQRGVEPRRAARSASMALKRPVETSQARGLAGTPSRGHCSSRGAEGVVQRLLGEVEVAQQADQRGEDPGRGTRSGRSPPAAHAPSRPRRRPSGKDWCESSDETLRSPIRASGSYSKKNRKYRT